MVDDFFLREPNFDDEFDVANYKREFEERNEYINGSDGLTKIGNYEDWLSRIEEDKNGKPQRTELLMIRKSDNKIVGMSNIRHSLEAGFEINGGHVGYSIRPSERKKGYGNLILNLSLQYCKSLGIKKALLTCNKNNIASKMVILKNGGVFESETNLENEVIERYWIDI